MKTILLIALGIFIGWYVNTHDAVSEVKAGIKSTAAHGRDAMDRMAE